MKLDRHRTGRLGSGFVRWPDGLRNTGEGGMFVYAVCDAGDRDGLFEHCHGVACAELLVRPGERHRGVSAAITLGETLIENDPDAGEIEQRCPEHGRFVWDYRAGTPFGECPQCGQETEDLGQRWPAQDRWFPYTREDDDRFGGHWAKYTSVNLHAAVCLGSSDGSWFDDQAGRYWSCSLDDLTVEGQALLASLELLYGHKPELLTFLDT